MEPPHGMEPCRRLYEIFQALFLEHSAQEGLLDLMNLSLAGDGTPVYTVARERKNVPVIVWKRASMTANITAFTASLTVTSTGIPTAAGRVDELLAKPTPHRIRTCGFSASGSL